MQTQKVPNITKCLTKQTRLIDYTVYMEKSFKEDKLQYKIAQQTCISCFSVFTKRFICSIYFLLKKTF